MKQLLKKGSTDQSVVIFIPDSSSTTGAGKTGLAYDTSSLACYYVRPGSAAAQLSLVTQTVTDAHADGGFVEIDATNMPGVYRLDLSDAILASGVNSAVVMLQGASGMAPVILEIELTDFDLHTAVQDVNTTKINGTTQTAKDLGALEVTNINTLAGHDPGATLVKVADLGTVQSGDAFARLGAPSGASVSADIAAVKAETATILTDTNELQTDLANGGRVDLLIDAIKNKTDNLPTDPADQSAIEAAITAATSSLATDAALAAVDSNVDAILADTNELQTEMADGGRLDLLFDAIKAKTDKMTFTSGNDLDVNVQKVNDTSLTGNGSALTPWGPA